MVGLNSTISRLSKLRALKESGVARRHADRLSDLPSFGSNPGALLARYYVPEGLVAGAPLVVVLHGCTQTAEGYDHGSGWSQLADRYGFALLFPQQQRSNNPNLCFNWFSPIDSKRGSGEALSIRQMVAAMVTGHKIDERRIFVTGLSAGGAMTSIMLAAYPELFAGGAIIAGLPFGTASSVPDAFARMRGEGYVSDERLSALVRDASPHAGPWPTISVWQGNADKTVDAANAERIIAQWQGVHGVAGQAFEQDVVDGAARRIWRDDAGHAVIEAYAIAGMGHGTPLHTSGTDGYGHSGAYMLEAGISSTWHIARNWGLIGEPAKDRASPRMPVPVSAKAKVTRVTLDPKPVSSTARSNGARQDIGGVGAIIENALRKAGLMK